MTGVLIFLALAPFALAFPNQLTERIVGGSAATIAELPYIVQVYTFDYKTTEPQCGGAIISESWVVTAAHCLVGEIASDIYVRAGSDQFNTGGVVKSASNIYVNDNFGFDIEDYDIALIKLASALTLSSSIASISLADSAVAAGTSAVVSGWGSLKADDSNAATQLQKATIPVVANSQCPANVGTVTERMLCAGSSSAAQSPCFGDSGGPLAVGNTLIGIVSHGVNCTGISVFANVNALRSWITSIASI